MLLLRRGSPLSLAPALLTLALGCGHGEPAAPAPTAQAELGRIERIVVATGTIEPVRGHHRARARGDHGRRGARRARVAHPAGGGAAGVLTYFRPTASRRAAAFSGA